MQYVCKIFHQPIDKKHFAVYNIFEIEQYYW